MFALPSEKLIIAFLEGSYLTLCQVETPFKPGRPAYTTENLYTGRWGDQTELNPEFDTKVKDSLTASPVLMVSHSPLNRCVIEKTLSEQDEQILKPLTDISGGYWLSSRGAIQVDTGQNSKFIKKITSLGGSVIGVASFGATLSQMVSQQRDEDQFLAFQGSDYLTLLAFMGTRLVHCRTLHCLDTQLEDHLVKFAAKTRKREQEWKPGKLIWIGPDAPGKSISVPGITLPVFSQEVDVEAICLQTCRSYLESNSDLLLTHRGKEKPVTTAYVRRSRWMVRWACILFLLILLAGLNVRYHQQDELYKETRSVIEAINPEHPAKLPSAVCLPKTESQFRLHRHLPIIGDSATRNAVILDSIVISSCRQIAFKGRSRTITGVNEFYQELADQFVEKSVEVTSPSTARDNNGDFGFSMEIKFGDRP